jgi:RNA polymerase sigma-70 factor (ECF subfamily)
MTEHELVAAAKGGDASAFEALVVLYEKRVYHLALRLCGNPEDAMDAAQEAFVSAWRGLSFFRQEAEFSTWLFRLTTNACIDLLRREKRAKGTASLDDEALGVQITDLRYEPETELERHELRAGIEAGLGSLSIEYRQVLVLRELEQLSYEEISQALELDMGTVKSRISRGRKQLQKYLIDHGNFFQKKPSNQAETTSKGGPAS